MSICAISPQFLLRKMSVQFRIFGHSSVVAVVFGVKSPKLNSSVISHLSRVRTHTHINYNRSVFVFSFSFWLKVCSQMLETLATPNFFNYFSFVVDFICILWMCFYVYFTKWLIG